MTDTVMLTPIEGRTAICAVCGYTASHEDTVIRPWLATATHDDYVAMVLSNLDKLEWRAISGGLACYFCVDRPTHAITPDMKDALQPATSWIARCAAPDCPTILVADYDPDESPAEAPPEILSIDIEQDEWCVHSPTEVYGPCHRATADSSWHPLVTCGCSETFCATAPPDADRFTPAHDAEWRLDPHHHEWHCPDCVDPEWDDPCRDAHTWTPHDPDRLYCAVPACNATRTYRPNTRGGLAAARARGR